MKRNRNTVYRNGSMNWTSEGKNWEYCWILIFTNNTFSIATLTAADGQIYLLYEFYGQPLFHTISHWRRKPNKNNRNIGISSSLHLDLHHVESNVYGKHTSIYTPISVKITPTSALYVRCQQYIHYPYLISSIKSVSVSYRGKYVSLVRMGSFYAKQGRRKSWFAKQFLRSIAFSTAILPKATMLTQFHVKDTISRHPCPFDASLDLAMTFSGQRCSINTIRWVSCFESEQNNNKYGGYYREYALRHVVMWHFNVHAFFVASFLF